MFKIATLAGLMNGLAIQGLTVRYKSKQRNKEILTPKVKPGDTKFSNF